MVNLRESAIECQGKQILFVSFVQKPFLTSFLNAGHGSVRLHVNDHRFIMGNELR